MKKPDAWMPLYIGDYLADTMHLNATESGSYLFLIMHYWRNGPLPDVERTLATVARVELDEWIKTVGPVVRAFFSIKNGMLHHKRIDAELGNATLNLTGRQKSARAAGLASAAKRKEQRALNRTLNVTLNHGSTVRSTVVEPQSNAQCTARATACSTVEQLEATPSPSPISKKETSLRDAKKAGSRIPPDWGLTDELRVYAASHGVDAGLAAEEFKNFWLAATKNPTKLDWNRTFQNRVLELEHQGKFTVRREDRSLFGDAPRTAANPSGRRTTQLTGMPT